MHGPVGSFSNYERKMLRATVSVMYRELRPTVGQRVQELFSLSEKDMLKQPVQYQVAWMERIKFLFQDQYEALIKDTVGKIRSEQEIELYKLQSLGMRLD